MDKLAALRLAEDNRSMHYAIRILQSLDHETVAERKRVWQILNALREIKRGRERRLAKQFLNVR